MLSPIIHFIRRIIKPLFAPAVEASHLHLPNLEPRTLGDLPPFTGSAEEGVILLQMPPAAKVKRRVISQVRVDGTIPELVEEMRLTLMGKVVSRTECILMDDHGQLGQPDQLKGRCKFCGAFSFQGGALCHSCNAFTCGGCGGKERICLCPLCAQDNWLVFAVNEKTQQQLPRREQESEESNRAKNKDS
jgi:hypothetical protein